MKKTPKRDYRLRSAKVWIKSYSGKSIVKGYSKKYSVDKLCAIKELRMLDVEISKEYEKQLRQSLKADKQHKLSNKQKHENEIEDLLEFESDEHFAMIMGYTSGGFAYGITHEEMDKINHDE
ncbi:MULTISPECIES: hypothetical protein [unclassified Carboxylicivirga]|uniref:hypothetical protein n=1 Tax=Carboxylicivirga TaxID=1628153 RepID=UPI003D3293E0